MDVHVCTCMYYTCSLAYFVQVSEIDHFEFVLSIVPWQQTNSLKINTAALFVDEVQRTLEKMLASMHAENFSMWGSTSKRNDVRGQQRWFCSVLTFSLFLFGSAQVNGGGMNSEPDVPCSGYMKEMLVSSLSLSPFLYLFIYLYIHVVYTTSLFAGTWFLFMRLQYFPATCSLRYKRVTLLLTFCRGVWCKCN